MSSHSLALKRAVKCEEAKFLIGAVSFTFLIPIKWDEDLQSHYIPL